MILSVLMYFFIALVTLSHVLFMVLEMFLWTKPAGLKIFRNSPEDAAKTKTLAQNQGLYNGFLAAGLIWGLISANPSFLIFFLVCIIIAGIYGGMTALKNIIFIQAVPAAIALLLVFLNY